MLVALVGVEPHGSGPSLQRELGMCFCAPWQPSAQQRPGVSGCTFLAFTALWIFFQPGQTKLGQSTAVPSSCVGTITW